MTQRISEERKTAYYVGLVLMVVGGLLFASTLLTFATGFGDFGSFQANASSGMIRALAGMGLLFVGAIVRSIGARGLAGSGAVLDPERARRDLEPYSRMVGGMAHDALDEADLDLGGGQPQQIVKVRCRSCGELNDQDAAFCKACGQRM